MNLHLPEQKVGYCQQVRTIPLPPQLIVPLRQHTGAPARAQVAVGHRVLAGQLLGTHDAFISAPVHAPASGTVTDIKPWPSFTGELIPSVVLQVDPDQQAMALEGMDPDTATVEDIRRMARAAGVVGMGGAAFPTPVKLTVPDGKSVDTLLVNGCECEPFLSCDHQVMLDQTRELVAGARLAMRAVSAQKCIFAIEANKPDAIAVLQKATSGTPGMSVSVLPSFYPHGAEKVLIRRVLGRKVPSGGLPSDVGALVHNVATLVALYEAVAQGRPLMERIITVAGRVPGPGNVRVLVGTPVGRVLEACGFAGKAARVVMGGPMMGWALSDLDTPVIKGTSGILVLGPGDVAELKGESCVRCARCINVCPMGLMPMYVGQVVESGHPEHARKWSVEDCFECGSCAYVCPARRPLVYYSRQAKAAIREKPARGA
ncbi:MAG: electron transport complex subunit RsxC [Bacillota bacterium]